MFDDEPEEQQNPHPVSPEKEKEIEAHRILLIECVASQTFDSLERRVAWILNNFPESRDSDVALAIRYWEVFDKEYFNGRALHPEALFKLTRINSLTRVRAKIQNTYRLFQASPVVRKRRGKLSEEEKAKALEPAASFPSLSVYADESGKTDSIVVVGSLWILNGFESYRTSEFVRQFKIENRISGEMHFKNISRDDVDKYIGLFDVLVNNASALCFKVISMNRSGAGHIQAVLDKLYYFLLKRGVEHEHSSGRTPLPRRLQVLKDLENEDADKLLLAQIKEQLTAVSASQFDGKLYLDDFNALGSEKVDLLQVADIVAASVARAYNHPVQTPTSPKDIVAHYILNKLGIPLQHDSGEYFGDMAVKLNLL